MMVVMVVSEVDEEVRVLVERKVFKAAATQAEVPLLLFALPGDEAPRRHQWWGTARRAHPHGH
jgi:hypothetical protein